MKNRYNFFALLLVFFIASCEANSIKQNQEATSRYFNSIQDDPNQLYLFLKEMPKGGDLHSHLSGASYAELMMLYDTSSLACINPQTSILYLNQKCLPIYQLKNINNNTELYNQLIDAWSMRHFKRSTEDPDQHFFNTFDKFDLLDSKRGEMLAEIISRAAQEHILHMQMIAYLHQLYPTVHISLHAGELALGQVPPEYLRNHIDEAINIAHAQRIGHGLDIAYEDNPNELLQQMSKRKIPIEINLTSNADILGISCKNHPFTLYKNSKVPIVLGTDDEGILRINLTHEYQRAVATYHLDYLTLKNIDRNSLSYSFLPGKSLWQDNSTFQPVSICKNDNVGNTQMSSACENFLKSSEKAQLQWKLEMELTQFEKQFSMIS